MDGGIFRSRLYLDIMSTRSGTPAVRYSCGKDLRSRPGIRLGLGLGMTALAGIPY